jgi:uncharacterized membrane protein
MKKVSFLIILGVVSTLYSADYKSLDTVKERKLLVVTKIETLAAKQKKCVIDAQNSEDLKKCESEFSKDLYEVRRMIKKFKNDRLRKEAFSK